MGAMLSTGRLQTASQGGNVRKRIANTAADNLEAHSNHIEIARQPRLPFTSPTTWTAHQMDPGPCHCFVDSLTKADIAKMDSLVAAAFHNLRCSLLCRLPEECLLNIMERLDILSIQCLRRTSRLFLRLYCSPTFSEGHDVSHYEQKSIHWHEPSPEYWRDEHQLPSLLERDIREYCADCRATRMGPAWKKKIEKLTTDYLHCSGCHSDHPVGFFSRAQRRVSSKKRICIGREGFVRLCGHKSLTWDKVTQIASVLSKLDTGKLDIKTEVSLATCENDSHFPKHHGRESPQILDQQICPRAIVVGDEEKMIAVVIQWVGHLQIPDLGYDELGRNKNATPKFIRQQLEQLRLGAAEFIAPQFPPGRLVEMNCFDPNNCCCLHYAGMERLPHGWRLTKDLCSTNCRANPKQRLGAFLPLQNDGGTMPQDQEERTSGHEISVPTVGCTGYGSPRMNVRITSCPGRDHCLQVRYDRKIPIFWGKKRYLDRVSTIWFRAVDPDSYNLTDDKESFGVLWCRTQGCRNYYRYLKKVLVPSKKTHRKCGESCPE